MYGSQWFVRGEIFRILTWVKRLPEAWRTRDPQVTEITAWAQLFRENERDVEATLAQLPDDAAYAISKQVIRGWMALRRGDMAQTIALSQAALSAFDDLLSDGAKEGHLMLMRTSATLNLAYAYGRLGDAERALTAFNQATLLSEHIGNVFLFETAFALAIRGVAHRDAAKMVWERGDEAFQEIGKELRLGAGISLEAKRATGKSGTVRILELA